MLTSSATEVCMARQPVLDRLQRCIGYELLHRGGRSAGGVAADGDAATVQTLDVALHLGGMADLTGGKLAFINFTQALLNDGVAALLPPDRTVIEVLETVRPTPETVEACRQLRRRGYQLALDDYTPLAEAGELETLVDIVKVDFLNTEHLERRAIANRFARSRVQLLAEKVESPEEFEEALKLGYQMFQGYFFCKPQLVQRRQLSLDKVNHLRFLQQVNEPELDFDRLEQTIRADAALAVRLLSYLNSASLGLREEVKSIRHALALLGELNLRRWASVFAVNALSEGKPAELSRTCLVRARFAESLAEASGKVDPVFDAFVLGMLSGMDAMLDRPLPELLRQISVSQAVKAALLGSSATPLGVLRRLVLAYEVGDWSGVESHCAAVGLRASVAGAAYRQAVSWVEGLSAE